MPSFDFSQFRTTKSIQVELDLICDAYARLFTDQILKEAHPGRDLTNAARRIGFGLVAHADLDSRSGLWVGYELPSWEISRDEMDFSEALLEVERMRSRIPGPGDAYPSHEDLNLILDEAERFIDAVVHPELGSSVSVWWDQSLTGELDSMAN